MKRFITFSFIAMALVFTVIGVVREQKNDATLDVSNALSVIAKQNDMAKCAVVNNNVVGKGVSKSKKDAEMKAAEEALRLFGVAL